MSTAILKAEGLHKSFGRKKIINNVSFELYPGEILGFLGPNGSGKTTTIKMILGLLDIDEGRVEIGGFDRQKEFEKALSLIGGIIENPDMYGYLSGYKNLEVFARMRNGVDRKRIDEVVKLVGLEKRIHNKVKTYSLGMKQRLGLAQAIVHRPKVLILDEPTNGLDPAGIKELRDVLKFLAHEQGLGIFVSSHILSEMQMLCDRVCIINKGEIVQTSSISKITESMGSYYNLTLRPADRALEVINKHMPDKLRSQEGEVFTISAGEQDINELIKELVSAGVGIFDVNHVTKTLEESYMEITGGGNIVE